MEVERTAVTSTRSGKTGRDVAVGRYLRIRVIKKLKGNRYMVEFGGKIHTASLKGNISSKLFIAKVAKIIPKLELKVIKTLDNEGFSIERETINGLLGAKKSFIQKLIASDNFPVSLSVLMNKDRKSLKENVRRSIKNQSILHIIDHKMRFSREVMEYFVLQNLSNLLNWQYLNILFPFRFGEKNFLCDLKYNGNKESENSSLFLTIFLDDERKIGFLVFIDYQTITCAISTNDILVERALKAKVDILANYLKSLNYNRKIAINIVPFDEKDYSPHRSLKSIDVKI
jgi:hypothetical protein